MFKPNHSNINTRLSLLLMAFLMLPVAASAGNVIIETPLGNIELEMLEEDAPNTVANFLAYVNGGNYDNSFVHRLEPGFVFQGGGYTFVDGVGAREVVDAIGELPVYNASNTFQRLPLIDYTQGDYTEANFVMTNMTELEDPAEPFVMNAGLNDAWYEPETSGQGFFITVLPARGEVIASWFTFDTEYPPTDASGNLMGVGQRWMQAAGAFNGNTAVLTNYITTGGLFDEPSTVTNTEDGTITLTFEDCNTGTVEYNIPSINRQGSIPIQRVADDNIALCQALFEEE